MNMGLPMFSSGGPGIHPGLSSSISALAANFNQSAFLAGLYRPHLVAGRTLLDKQKQAASSADACGNAMSQMGQ